MPDPAFEERGLVELGVMFDFRCGVTGLFDAADRRARSGEMNTVHFVDRRQIYMQALHFNEAAVRLFKFDARCFFHSAIQSA